ncbi:MAG: hypothetical protein V3W14_03985 [Candidatus Neomarinimicrobiota bacterium]
MQIKLLPGPRWRRSTDGAEPKQHKSLRRQTHTVDRTLVALALLLLIARLPGQGFWQRNNRTHPELEWQVLTTPHFNIYYHQGIETIARRGAAIAEQIYQPIMDQLRVADFGRTDLIFSDEDEIANGFALPSDQIFIWVRQSDTFGWFTGSEKWLRQVIAHEFQHVVFMHAVRTWLGVINLVAVPAWLVEGTAEYYTEQWRAGRSENDLKIHTYRNRLNRLDPHDSGYAKVLYLTDRYGDSTLVRIVHYRDTVKVGGRALMTLPYSYRRAFRQVTGRKTADFDEDWRRAMNTYYYSYRGQKESVAEVGQPVPLPGLKAVRGLAFAPDSSKVAVIGRVDQGQRDWELYVIATDSTQRRVRLDYGRFSGHPAWSADGKLLAVSVWRRGRHGSLTRDIRLYDTGSGSSRWLTHQGRAIDPVWSPGGEAVLYAGQPGESGNLFLTAIADGATRQITNFTGDVQVQSPRWSPSGDRIAFAVQEEDGYVDIAVVGADGSGYQKVIHDPAEDLTPLWSRDGNWIVFTSFRNATPNLYRVPSDSGAATALTDVAEGLFAAQIEPGSGDVVALTLADVDTVRIRRIPVDREVVVTEMVIREEHASWRQGRPVISLPESDPVAGDGSGPPEAYRWWRTVRPITIGGLPYPSGAAIWGAWTDALGKHQLIVAGNYDLAENDWGGYTGVVVASQAPFISFGAYRHARLRIRGWGDGYLVEELNGLEVGARLPFNFGKRLSSNHQLAVQLRGFRRLPVSAEDSSASLGRPVEATEGGLSLAYRWKSQRPHRAAAYLPPQGAGISVRWDVYTSSIFGDYDYNRLELETFRHQPIASTGLVVFARLIGTALTGSPPPQDRVGLLTDSPVYINPGSPLNYLGELIETPETHSLRGLEETILGRRAWSGTLELRLPLARELPVKVAFLGLGHLTAAVFTDFGGVPGVGDPIVTQGLELKVNLLVGKLPLVTLAGGRAGDREAWKRRDPLTYFSFGLVSPL